MTATCRGLGCGRSDLIEAHIIPKGFARLLRNGSSKHTISVTLDRAEYARPMLGEYDPNILCSSCDNKLGKYDDYAIDVCENFESRHRKLANDELFEVPSFDGSKFAKFVLAVLWRGSISSRATYSSLKLGPYEDIARDVLFEQRGLDEFPEYQLFVNRYTSEYMDTSGFYTIPVPSPIDGLRAYGFGLCGFRVIAKIDKRPLRGVWTKLTVNDASSLRGFFLKFEETLEFRAMVPMVVADLKRKDIAAGTKPARPSDR